MVPSEISPFPPPELAPAEKLAPLRYALEQNQYEEAEREWLILIRGLRGHSEQEKQLLSKAYECFAAVLSKEGKDAEAGRMLSRSRVVKDGVSAQPKKIERRETTYSFMKEIQNDEGADHSKVAEVRLRVEEQIAASERRLRAMKIAGSAMVGLIGGPFLGINGLITGALGFVIGWVLFARR